MKIKEFYQELEEDQTKFNKKSEIAVEESLDAVVQLYKDVAYFKLCIKKYGLSKIFKLANIQTNVSVDDIKNKIEGDEEEVYAWIKYLEKETGVDRLKISNWLNQLSLEDTTTNKEGVVVNKIRSYLEKLSASRYFYAIK